MRKNSYGKKLKRGSPANKCAFKYKGKFYTYYSLVKGFSHSHTRASILDRRSTCGSQPILQINSRSSHIYLTLVLHPFLFQLFICHFIKSSPWRSPLHSHASYFWSGAAGREITILKSPHRTKTVTAFAHSISWRYWVKKQFGTAFLSVVSHLLSMCSVC